jgi:hypothetical protein
MATKVNMTIKSYNFAPTSGRYHTNTWVHSQLLVGFVFLDLLVFCVVFCRLLYILLSFSFVLLFLWFTGSDYPFGTFKLSISSLGRPNCVLHAHVAVELYVLAIIILYDHNTWTGSWRNIFHRSIVKYTDKNDYEGMSSLFWNYIDVEFGTRMLKLLR